MPWSTFPVRNPRLRPALGKVGSGLPETKLELIIDCAGLPISWCGEHTMYVSMVDCFRCGCAAGRTMSEDAIALTPSTGAKAIQDVLVGSQATTSTSAGKRTFAGLRIAGSNAVPTMKAVCDNASSHASGRADSRE